ncbi:hypothetical protein EAH_00023090 [Eimeria acervulina]|uniref:Uncharacterized protein n=1 Tax=Eimeria acervulina TaxID=5801 RepID=U6GSW1_EIMAC|nr:hypothetical protein EAH_00023090 [Eimeria acervulina]CDI81669.1 hypothetical protein EAH_00023090 [Eimeria acervulina]
MPYSGTGLLSPVDTAEGRRDTFEPVRVQVGVVSEQAVKRLDSNMSIVMGFKTCGCRPDMRSAPAVSPIVSI